MEATAGARQRKGGNRGLQLLLSGASPHAHAVLITFEAAASGSACRHAAYKCTASPGCTWRSCPGYGGRTRQ